MQKVSINEILPLPVSKCVRANQSDFILLNLCRKAIRNHPLDLNFNTNLSMRIPQLDIPHHGRNLLCEKLLEQQATQEESDNEWTGGDVKDYNGWEQNPDDKPLNMQ